MNSQSLLGLVVAAMVMLIIACSGARNAHKSAIDETRPVGSNFIPLDGEYVGVEVYPEMIYSHSPVYPEELKRSGIEGIVWVKALVNETGEVLDAIVGKSSGVAELDQAALKAAYECKYKPGIQDGLPVKVWVTYKVEFKVN